MEDYPPDVLQKMLHFDAADLRENRAGRLSARQMKRLTWARHWRLFHLAAVAVCAGILVIGIILMQIGLVNSQNAVNILFFSLSPLILILSWGGDLRKTWEKYRLLGDDLERQEVRMVEGQAAVGSETRGGFFSHKESFFTLMVGSTVLPISSVLYYPLKPETWCRVYYTSVTNYVLAVERERDVEAAPRDEGSVNVHSQ